MIAFFQNTCLPCVPLEIIEFLPLNLFHTQGYDSVRTLR